MQAGTKGKIRASARPTFKIGSLGDSSFLKGPQQHLHQARLEAIAHQPTSRVRPSATCQLSGAVEISLSLALARRVLTGSK